ncbi:MAG TPA: hypothetical protein PLD84_06315 [Chitinophagales bacterium]|nr:hypothetical protein [Chitinophagales bacterium]
MKILFTFLFGMVSTSVFSQNIIECSLQPANGSVDLQVYLTDTSGVYGFSIKIGSAFDGNDLLNEQYVLGSLPENATLIENTFSVSLDEMNSSPKYVWVTLLLTGAGSKEIKVTAD